MPRRKVTNDNWSRLGELVLDVWSGKVDARQLRDNPHEVLKKYGVKLDPKDKVKVHFDKADTLNIVIPHNPRSEMELARVGDNDAYKRELGLVIMGGCR
jgi:hypothetical protein